MKKSYLSIVSGLLLFLSSCGPKADIIPESLRVEHMINPSVIESISPRMSWINEPRNSSLKNLGQTAYQILVASDKSLLKKDVGDVWDSGLVESDQSYLVKYAGASLLPGKDYFWKVRVQDNSGQLSGWSDIATFGTGLRPEDWQAQWIGAPWQGEEASADYVQAPVFSKTFDISTKGLVSAKFFGTGLGYFELLLNDKKVGDDYLVPNFTDFGYRAGLNNKYIVVEDNFTEKSVLYLAYDLKDYLKNGKNTIEAIVGNGFYNTVYSWVEPYGSPRFIGQINLEYADGTTKTIGTDESWLATPSKITFNNVYLGEIYNAGYEGESFNAVIRNAPGGQMKAHVSPTDKILKTLAPVSFEHKDDGSYDVDFGEEISGWIALSNLKGEKGDTINVSYVCESPLGVHKYVMDGSGAESYAPRFTWYVFSKANISGIDNLNPEQVQAQMVGTNVREDAVFEASDTIVNKISDIWLRTQSDNMHGCIASDCPHRERSPYTGDGQVACAMVMANYDAAAFYEKWIRDMRDTQNPETGYVPNSAPWQPGCGGGVGWGAAMNIIPWEYYLNYGDVSILEDNYQAMKLHIDDMLTWVREDGTMFQQKHNPGAPDPMYWFNLGDWLPPHELPLDDLVHTFFLWDCVNNTAKAAEVLGLQDDAAKFKELAEKTKTAFHNRYYDAENKTYGRNGANTLALAMGVPDSVKADVVATLRNEIEVENNGHLNTGICGTRYLFSVLAENGMADLAYKVMTAKGFPGYVDWLDKGSTTMWENWNGEASHNHPMFGGGLVWLYRDLAGVNYDPQAPGYKHIIVAPKPVEGLDKVSYTKNTPYGKLVSTVTNTDSEKSVKVTVPVGSTASIYLPGSDEVMEVGQGTYLYNF